MADCYDLFFVRSTFPVRPLVRPPQMLLRTWLSLYYYYYFLVAIVASALQQITWKKRKRYIRSDNHISGITIPNWIAYYCYLGPIHGDSGRELTLLPSCRQETGSEGAPV